MSVPHIPTEADLLSLATNDTLEIAGGDVVTATYIDDVRARYPATTAPAPSEG